MKEMIEDAMLHLQNFVVNLDKRIADGAWSGMLKKYEWCAPGLEYGGAGLAICLENMEEKVLAVYLPYRRFDDKDRSDVFYACIPHEDAFIRAILSEDGNYISEEVATEEELCNRVFKALDLLYESKKYLTGSDFSKYELNPDIEIDEYGVLYHRPTHTLLCCRNQDIEEYWIKEGTTRINECAFRDLKYLKILVFPESLEYIGYNGILNCSALQILVIKSLDLSVRDVHVACTKDNPLSILIPKEYDKNNLALSNFKCYVFDKEKMKRKIISPQNDNCTYRELKSWLETLSDEQLDEKIYIRSNVDSPKHPFHKHALTMYNSNAFAKAPKCSFLGRKLMQYSKIKNQLAEKERRQRIAQCIYKTAPDTEYFNDSPSIGLRIEIDTFDLYDKRR